MASNGTPPPNPQSTEEESSSTLKDFLGMLTMPKPRTPLDLLKVSSPVGFALGNILENPTKLDKEAEAFAKQWFATTSWPARRVADLVAQHTFWHGEEAVKKLKPDGQPKPKDILGQPIEKVYYPDEQIEWLRKNGFDITDLPVEPKALAAFWGTVKHPIDLAVGLVSPVGDLASMIYNMAKPGYGPNAPLLERVYKDATKLHGLVYGLTLKPLVENIKATKDPNDPYSHINIEKGIWKTTEDLLPLHEGLALLTGRDPDTKKILTPKEWGKAFSTGMLKLFALKAGADAIRTRFRADISPPPIDVPVSKVKEMKMLTEEGSVRLGEAAGKRSATAKLKELKKPLSEGAEETVDLNSIPVSKKGMEAKIQEKLDALEEDGFGKFTVGDFVDVYKEMGLDPSDIPDLSPAQLHAVFDRLTTGLNDIYENSPDRFQQILFDVAFRRARRAKLLQAAGKATESPKMTVLADMIRAEVIGPRALADVFKRKVLDTGMAPEQVAKEAEALATLVEDTLSKSGGRLNAIAKTSVEGLEQALKGHPEAVEALGGLKKALARNYKYMGAFEKFNYFWKRYALKWTRGGATAQPATTMRNAFVQGGAYAANTWEDFLGDTRVWLKSVQNRLQKGEPLMSPGEAFHQTLFDITNLLHHMHGASVKGYGTVRFILGKLGEKTGINTYKILPDPPDFKPLWKGYDELMDALSVGERAKLEHTFSMEFEPANVLDKAYWKIFWEKVAKYNRDPTYSVLGRLGEQGAAIGDAFVDIGGLGNMAQELFWRRAFFMRAVEKGARERGYTGYEDFMKAVKEGHADDRVTMIGGFHNVEEAAARLEKFKTKDLPAMVNEEIDKLSQSFKARTKNPYALGQKIINAKQKMTNDLMSRIDETLGLLADGVDPNEALGNLPDSIAARLGGEVESDMTVISRARHEAHLNTFAATPPRYTFAGRVLEAFKVFPFAHILGGWFPRFLINSYQWMNERNPLAWSKFGKTRIAEELDAMVGKGTTVGLSRRALDEWARHVDGTIMLATSKVIQGSSLAGPHYYQVWTGLKNERGDKIYWDVRPLQPFSTIMFLQRAFEIAATGGTFKGAISAADMTDALIGVRRMQDQLGFALTDIVRQISTDSTDSFWRSVRRLGGQPLAMPFLGLRGWMNLLADTGLGKAYSTIRDTAEQEFTGPVLNDIAPEALPGQYNPYTGELLESKVEPVVEMGGKKVKEVLGPRFRQMTGMSLQASSPMEDYFTHLGISTGDLVGRWKSREANAVVRRVMGAILGGKTETGETLNSTITRVLREGLKSTPDTVARMIIVDNFIVPFRQMAVELAVAEAPKAFAEEGSTVVKGKMPKEMREMLQKFVKERLPSHIDVMGLVEKRAEEVKKEMGEEQK